MKTLEFEVDVCLGHGDGGTVCVDVDVTDDEYESLMVCCRDEDEIDGYPGLEDLCNRIKEAAKAENESCRLDTDSEEEIDYSGASCRICMPDEISDAVEEDDEVSWFDYEDYPFAMETVNGTILSMTEEFQRTLLDRVLEKCHATEEELAAWLLSLEEDDEEEEDEEDESNGDFSLIEGIEYGEDEYMFLEEVLGFDGDEGFDPGGVSDSKYGWQAKELLEKLGFTVYSSISYGAHGHDTNGVYYIDEI